MTKQELTTLLRSVGVNENTITAMENAYDMGVEHGRSEFVKIGTAPAEDKSAFGISFQSIYKWQGDEA
jgi:hypothetical protein